MAPQPPTSTGYQGITPFDKAIAAFIVTLVVQGAGHFGLNIDPAILDALNGLIALVVVYLVPNKPAA